MDKGPASNQSSTIISIDLKARVCGFLATAQLYAADFASFSTPEKLNVRQNSDFFLQSHDALNECSNFKIQHLVAGKDMHISCFFQRS